MTPQTKIEDLTFKGAWRLKKAVRKFNYAVDKADELHTLEDLDVFNCGSSLGYPPLLSLQGIGPKTYEAIKDILNDLAF